ncbi:hypothetical protein [Actinokineospora bangkokensis]|uniref:hypothetical protein n=1 Tax=Actinokineospora bangkokensis TaxID=1193682 RepID=UPI0009FC1777|nr:hypothetical protein [Actinokineospora bangkokensis]
MRWALVSGDGLPVSGLLTIFRNVVDRAARVGLELPVTADLGYSWRPDKGRFFPRGLPGAEYPGWLRVSDAVPVAEPDWAEQVVAARKAVAAGAVDADVAAAVERAAQAYADYFFEWFTREDVDWVVAINLTLSDSVAVTTGLHRAADRRWGDGRAGGVLHWDHDLFGSCGIVEDGERYYPAEPNAHTPVPGSSPSDRWAVVSEALLKEARGYPTELEPVLLTNVLPLVPEDGLAQRHHEFLRQRDIAGRPVVLVPVRVFAVKGVDIAVEVFAGLRDEHARAGHPEPVLLVFGSLDEDPGYAEVVRAAVARSGAAGSVHFLDGVPITSHRDHTGAWRLDEVDLLRLARASRGAVLFTPGVTDVETVGLGPALAALADLPCAVTPYDAFDDHFGPGYARVDVDPADPRPAGAELSRRMPGGETANRALVASRFPDGPWVDHLTAMAEGRA